MATRIRVRRLANPRRKVRARRRHNRRRRLTAKQIRYFGTKRQRAALRSHNRRRNIARPRRRNIKAGFYDEEGYFHPIRASSDYSPSRAGERTRRKVKSRRRRNPRRRRSLNPALVVTLGATNPRKRRRVTKVARRRTRRHNAHRRRRRVYVRHNRRRRSYRARNPRRTYRRRRRHNARVVVVSRRRHNRRRHYRRRRNPLSLLGGQLTGRRGLTLVGGGLLGVAFTKFLPTVGPIASFASGSTLMRVVTSFASAWIGGFLAGKINPELGDAAFFGGLMQTGSVALNALLPGFKIGGVPIGLSGGLGDLVAGSFPVPQNPIRAAIPPPVAPTQARVQMSGLQRAYGWSI